ncbi:MAG: PilZ domain-containing protein [Synechococcaceae cyanobacterium]|nr:PilZ domain-containing protein [Synechococcaceae cyanobacterium]
MAAEKDGEAVPVHGLPAASVDQPSFRDSGTGASGSRLSGSGRSGGLQADPLRAQPSRTRKGRRPGEHVQIQRREPRYSAPFLDVIIHVELIIAGRRHAGRLWDISCSGACVRVFSKIPVGGLALLRFHEPSGREIVETYVRLLWCNEVRGMTYVGMCFVDPIDFDQTFLRNLLHDGRGDADNL